MTKPVVTPEMADAAKLVWQRYRDSAYSTERYTAQMAIEAALAVMPEPALASKQPSAEQAVIEAAILATRAYDELVKADEDGVYPFDHLMEARQTADDELYAPARALDAQQEGKG